MGKKDNDWKGRLGMVYSTNPDFQFQKIEENDVQLLLPERQRLRVSVERHGHGGKTVTIIRGFSGSDEDMKELARSLKSFCGTGGAVKDGEILVQGELREKIIARLLDLGYKDTK